MIALKTRTRRCLVGLATALAATTIGLATTNSPASAYTTSNTGYSSTGAFLQSTGICGYSQFRFTIDSRGFEYIQVGFVTRAGTIWGGADPVAQSTRVNVPVPALAGNQYYVVGWDWTTRGWETVWVLTDFWHPNSYYNLNGC